MNVKKSPIYEILNTVIDSPVTAQTNNANITIHIQSCNNPDLKAAPALIIILDFFVSVFGPRSVVAALTVTWNGAAKCASVDVCRSSDAS